jgi:hypothetical protein
MSPVTPARRPTRERLLRDQRLAKMTAVAALAAVAVLIATLVFVTQGDDTPTAATQQPAVQAEQQRSDSARRITKMYENRSTAHASGAGVAVRPQTRTPDEDGIK